MKPSSRKPPSITPPPTKKNGTWEGMVRTESSGSEAWLLGTGGGGMRCCWYDRGMSHNYGRRGMADLGKYGRLEWHPGRYPASLAGRGQSATALNDSGLSREI